MFKVTLSYTRYALAALLLSAMATPTGITSAEVMDSPLRSEPQLIVMAEIEDGCAGISYDEVIGDIRGHGFSAEEQQIITAELEDEGYAFEVECARRGGLLAAPLPLETVHPFTPQQWLFIQAELEDEG